MDLDLFYSSMSDEELEEHIRHAHIQKGFRKYKGNWSLDGEQGDK